MKTRQSFLLTVLTLLVSTMALAAVSAHASGGGGNNDGNYDGNNDGNYDGDHGGHHNNHGQLDCSQATPSKKRLWPANYKLKL